MTIEQKTILGFDPGRDKCGVAIVSRDRKVYHHATVNSQEAIASIQALISRFTIDSIVMGNLTTSKIWYEKLQTNFPDTSIIMVDERNSTLEARDRYWQMYPPQGWQKLIPHSLRLPPRPVDDIVAILLVERHLSINKSINK